MATKASTRRKHQRRCDGCRRLYATHWLYPGTTANRCPRCVGPNVEYGAGLTGHGCPERGHPGAPALAPAHRKHVRRHRPGVREAKP